MQNETTRVNAQSDLEKHRINADVRKEEIRLAAEKEKTALIVALAENHTKQMALLRAAYEQDSSNVIGFAASDIVPWRSAMLDLVPPAGKIAFNGVRLDAPPAKRLAKTARKLSRAARKELSAGRVDRAVSNGWITGTIVLPREENRRRLEPPMKLGANV